MEQMMSIYKIAEELKRIAKNEQNEDKAKILIAAYLKEKKRNIPEEFMD